MKRFAILSGAIVVTALGLWAMGTLFGIDPRPVLGLPPLASIDGGPAWLSVGAGVGVLVVGLAGAGVVSFTLYGAGLLFSTGQLTVGLIALGQLGVGLILFLGQVGGGLVGAGQAVGGGLVWGQGSLGFDGKTFIQDLNADVTDLMRFR